MWKREIITPIPKIHPAPSVSKLRPLSGVYNFAKIADKIMANIITDDMAQSRDPSQYGNEKGLSVNHYLINMLDRILTSVDKNTNLEKMSAILSMVDWSQAFERQSHFLGIKSFISNGVRKSLIPLLINFFQDRFIIVKWNNTISKSITVNGGGPQGVSAGILEYISQTTQNFNFLKPEDIFKFIDDASFIEILNLISVGLSSYNCKVQVPSDIATNDNFIPTERLKTQSYLDQISDWTKNQKMKLNCDKTMYMILNFCSSKQYQTRLYLENQLLEQVRETKLLGVIISDDLTWHKNTDNLVRKAYMRMTIIRKLYEFKVELTDLIKIYILYIRSTVEQSAVVWASSLTEEERRKLERVQKIALRIILKDKYISYNNALEVTKLSTLEERRVKLMQNFATKCTQNEKTAHMFPLNENKSTRVSEKFKVPFAYTKRLANSAIPTMARLLNKM